MEIGTQHPGTQSSTTQVNPIVQQPVNEELDTEIKETALSADSTLDLSDAGQTLATSTVTRTSNTAEVDNEDAAQQSVEQFQQDAANDPSITELAQSSNVTSDAIKNLIG